MKPFRSESSLHNPYTPPRSGTERTDAKKINGNWLFFVRTLVLIVGIGAAGYALDFASLVVTNVLGGLYIPDSIPTPRQRFWWDVHHTLQPLIVTVTGLLIVAVITLQLLRRSRRV